MNVKLKNVVSKQIYEFELFYKYLWPSYRVQLILTLSQCVTTNPYYLPTNCANG